MLIQNMHKHTTHDRPLTGVHWPNHRSRGGGTKDDLSMDPGGTHRGTKWGGGLRL